MTRRPYSAFLPMLCLTLSACKQEHETPSATTSSPATAQVPSAPASATSSAASPPPASASAAPEKPKGLFESKLPEGLSALDLTPVDVDTMKRSTDIDTRAGKARKAKDYSRAVDLYVEALKVDPGNRPARYNLARTLVSNDQRDSGLAVLDQLYRAEDCYRCEGLLLAAAQEKDFAPVAERPEFKERTEGIGKELPTVEEAAKKVLKWLGEPTFESMPPLVDSRTFIVLDHAGHGFKMFKGAKAFLAYVVEDEKTNFPKGRKWGGTIGPPMGMSYECPNECCEIDTYDPPKGRSVLRQMCFKTQGNVAISLYKLKAD